MLIASVQAVLAIIACALLFFAWRKLASHGRRIALIVGAGLLVRAVLGQILFWVSYLVLPYGLRMQSGNGLWFFGVDGIEFVNQATHVANQGIGAIVRVSPQNVSAAFIQVLGFAQFLFGNVVSAALVLNLAAYLGTCAILLALARNHPRVGAIAVAAISFSPSLILWSLQPIKDIFFVFLIAAFVWGAAIWTRSARENHPGRAILISALLVAIAYALVGTRWYFALALFLAAVPLFLIESIRSAAPLRSLLLTVTMYVLFIVSTLYIAGPFIPPPLREAMTSPNVVRTAVRAPQTFMGLLDGARYSFDQLQGSTKIQVSRTAPAPAPSARTRAGAAVLFVPRAIGHALGLFNVGGGRGSLYFAIVDVDTLYFDLFVLVGLTALVRARPREWGSPLLWLVIAVSVIIAVAISVSVTNFGALFRYRSMIFIGAVLVPVVIVSLRREAVPVVQIEKKPVPQPILAATDPSADA